LPVRQPAGHEDFLFEFRKQLGMLANVCHGLVAALAELEG
jgi:hypothetical protein